jgi:hypothetical protein
MQRQAPSGARVSFTTPWVPATAFSSRTLSNQCLMALIQAVRDMGIVKSNAVLMFDGIMDLREDVHASYAQENAPMDIPGLLQ